MYSRHILRLSFFMMLLITVTGVSHACDCILTPSAEKAYATATEVFSGTVLSIEKTGATDSMWMSVKITFSVTKVWKGAETRIIFTDMGSNCGYSFKTESAYLVYATDQEGVLQTNICTRTKLLQHAEEDLKYLAIHHTVK